MEHLDRAPQLHQTAGTEHGDAIADRQRVVLVMGHEDRRRPRRVQDRDDVVAHPGPQVGVEARERLVEQHQRRLRCQGARQRDPLTLATRQLVWIAIAIVGHPDELEHLHRPRAGVAVTDAELDVRRHRQVREQGVLLEHQPHPPLLRGDRGADVVDGSSSQADLSAVDRVETGDRAQQRRLAAATRPDKPEHLVITDAERHVVERDDVTETLRDVFEVERGHAADILASSGPDASPPTEVGPNVPAMTTEWRGGQGRATSRRRESNTTGNNATAMIESAGSAACSKRDSDARL